MNFKEELHKRVKRYKGKLTYKQLSELYEAIIDYGNGSKPLFEDAAVALVFNSFIDELDADREKTEARAARSRANGAKGGRPRKTPLPTKVQKAKMATKEETLDLEAFAAFFNKEIIGSNSAIPQVTKLSERRKAAVRARMAEYGKENLAKAVRMAVKSDFLNGRTDTTFTASFDWIFKPSNFIKIIEGNYDNKHSRQQVIAAPNSAEQHKADDGW